jgi:hypothetical protein
MYHNQLLLLNIKMQLLFFFSVASRQGFGRYTVPQISSGHWWGISQGAA